MSKIKGLHKNSGKSVLFPKLRCDSAVVGVIYDFNKVDLKIVNEKVLKQAALVNYSVTVHSKKNARRI